MDRRTIYTTEIDGKEVLVYILEGNPTPLARPRFGQNRVFDSQKQRKINHGLALRYIHGNKPLYEGPLRLDVTFYLPAGKSFSAEQRNKLYGTPRPQRPDIDNLIKYILDAANGVLYKDDALIASVYADKVYDKNPRTEFTILELT